MKLLAATACLASLLAAGMGSAQTLDLSTLTCKAFLDSSGERVGLIMMWMDGYFRDARQRPAIDFDRMKAKAAQLERSCTRNPGQILIKAAGPIMEGR